MESNPVSFTLDKPHRRLSLIIPRKHHLLENNTKSLGRLISMTDAISDHYPPKSIKTNTLKQIAKEIVFVPNKSEKEKNSVGGLYSLFSSTIFDVHLLLYYLDTKEETDIIDELVHLMNTKFNNEVFRFLPQLLSILLSKKSTQSMQSFLLANCKLSIAFALKVEWLSNAFYPKVLLKKNQKPLKQLVHFFHNTLIDNRREAISTRDDRTFDYKDYHERIDEFYNCLFSIDVIKAKTNEEFLIEAKKIIGKCNKKLHNLHRIGLNCSQIMTPEEKTMYKGFILPIDNKLNTIDDQEQLMITNLIEDGISLCFNQSSNNLKSISYLIPFECIEVKEGVLWNDKLIPPQEEKDNEVLSKSDYSVENKQKDMITNQHNNKSLGDSLYLKLNPFTQSRDEVNKDIKQKSLYRNFDSYTIKHFIFKTKTDYCNEMIIMQMIYLLSTYFKEADIPLRLTPFQIEVLSESTVLIEQIPNVISLIELNQKIEGKMNMNTFFRNFFCNNFEEAQKNFVESLAAYILVSYLVNSQERIGDNLLLDVFGKVVLRKFGHCFAPNDTNYSMFQLPKDIKEIMDGNDSGMFYYYKSLIVKGFLEVKKHVDVFIKLIESELKCLRIVGFSDKDRKSIVASMTGRFLLTYSDVDVVLKVEKMVQ